MTGFWIGMLFLFLGAAGYRVMDRVDRFLQEHVTQEEAENEPKNDDTV